MADEWFVRVQGKDYGPVDLDTLREWKREGRLIADNEVREAEAENWVKAETLFATMTEAPAPSAASSVVFAAPHLCAKSSARLFAFTEKDGSHFLSSHSSSRYHPQLRRSAFLFSISLNPNPLRPSR